MDAKILGSFILMLRKEKSMTQSQLAEKIHVTDKAISKWERGIGIPDISNIEALAEALDVTVAEIIQCKKQVDASVKSEEVSEIINTAFDIVKYQEQITRRRIITGLVFAAVGVIMVFAGIHYLISPVVVRGGGDGPNAVFLAAKISPYIPIIVIIIGGLLLMASLWKIIKTRS